MEHTFNLKDLEYLERGTEIWVMSNNKPICYYVFGIIINQYLHNDSDYGSPYNHSIVTSIDYMVRDIEMNDYQSKVLLLSSIPIWFKTKQELINSL